MALVKKFGKPDLFLTMTANPNWPEIADNLRGGETAYNRPDLTARVFKLKLKQLTRSDSSAPFCPKINKNIYYAKTKLFKSENSVGTKPD